MEDSENLEKTEVNVVIGNAKNEHHEIGTGEETPMVLYLQPQEDISGNVDFSGDANVTLIQDYGGTLDGNAIPVTWLQGSVEGEGDQLLYVTYLPENTAHMQSTTPLILQPACNPEQNSKESNTLISVEVIREKPTRTTKPKPRKKKSRAKKTENVNSKWTGVISEDIHIETKLQVLDAMLPPVARPPLMRRPREGEEDDDDDEGKPRPYVCDFCGASFVREPQYYGHLHTHTSERQWTCETCQAVFTSQSTLRKHEKIHLNLRPHVCKTCGMQFDRESQLQYHERRIHQEERSHSCQICHKSWFKRSDLRNHLNIHLGIRKNICETCGRQFHHRSNLIRHSRIHTGIRPYVCKDCGYRFTQVNALQHHRMQYHGNGGPSFTCHWCNKVVRSASLLRKHMRIMHTNDTNKPQTNINTIERHYYCQICGENFRFSALLQEHEMRSHAAECTYHCHCCGQDFSEACKLKSHSCGPHLQAKAEEESKPEEKSVLQETSSVQLETFLQQSILNWQGNNGNTENSNNEQTEGISGEIVIYVRSEGQSEPTPVRIKYDACKHQEDIQPQAPVLVDPLIALEEHQPNVSIQPSIVNIPVAAVDNNIEGSVNQNKEDINLHDGQISSIMNLPLDNAEPVIHSDNLPMNNGDDSSQFSMFSVESSKNENMKGELFLPTSEQVLASSLTPEDQILRASLTTSADVRTNAKCLNVEGMYLSSERLLSNSKCQEEQELFLTNPPQIMNHENIKKEKVQGIYVRNDEQAFDERNEKQPGDHEVFMSNEQPLLNINPSKCEDTHELYLENSETELSQGNSMTNEEEGMFISSNQQVLNQNTSKFNKKKHMFLANNQEISEELIISLPSVDTDGDAMQPIQFSEKPKGEVNGLPLDSISVIDITLEKIEIVGETTMKKEEPKIKTKKNYKCSECARVFNKNSNYKQHLGMHFAELQQYQCTICGNSYAWKSSLNKHMMSVHPQTQDVHKLMCNLCDKEFSMASLLHEHTRRDHQKERTHVCPDCPKTFYKKSDLTVHLRTHTRERPYMCGQCGKTFVHLSHIIRHERIHSGVKPYQCDLCGKSFTQSSTLKMHRVRHSNPKTMKPSKPRVRGPQSQPSCPINQPDEDPLKIEFILQEEIG